MKKKWMLPAVSALLAAFLLGCSGNGATGGSQAAAPSASSAGPKAPVSSAQGASSASSKAAEASSAPVSSADPAPASTPEAQAKEKLSGMTLEQKVGQLFFLCFRQDANGNNLYSLDDASLGQLRDIQPGGVVLFGENISDIDQVRGFIQSVKDNETLPPFLSIDQEGGVVQRIKNTDSIPATDIPPMLQVGNTGDLDLAREVGRVLGSELSVFGFNMDFAPDSDVFSNPNNTVIGNRSFSSDPAVVAAMSMAVSAGLRDTGLIPAVKHFPGHGDTDADTHVGFAISYKTREELNQTELVPFQKEIQNGAEMVMVAHISLPEICGDETPATLATEVVTDILRKDLGFDGVAITDSLAMGAITENFSAERAAVLAIEAGMDMLLMPADPYAAYNAVLGAVRDGTISQERLDQSVLRILKLKYQYDLFTEKPLPGTELLGSDEHWAVVNRITG